MRSTRLQIRWLQFSMRGILLLTAVAAMLMSLVGVPLFRLREQLFAAERLEKSGARLTSEAAHGLMAWAAAKLFGPKAAMHVTRVAWKNGQVDAADLAPLESLQWVQSVDLAWKSVDDEGAAHLRHLQHLTTLNLNGAALTDRGLRFLADCQSLQRLQLHGAPVTDEGMSHLAALKALENLDLSGTRITGTNLEALLQLPGLEILNLNGSRLTDAALPVLSRLKHLRWLGVSHTRLSEAADARLAVALPAIAIDD